MSKTPTLPQSRQRILSSNRWLRHVEIRPFFRPVSAHDRIFACLSLLFWLLILRGPTLATALQGPQEGLANYFQDYASARNWAESLPIYESHSITVPRYLQGDGTQWPIVVNAHPPTSILLAIPFSRSEFREALLAWNLISLALLAWGLWIMARALRLSPPFWMLIAAILLVSAPLLDQVEQGQLNLVLTFLVIAAWAADREAKPIRCGILLAIAASVKLFPAFLFLHYALRRKWTILVSGIVTMAILAGLTALILGGDVYRAYASEALPLSYGFRVSWKNASLLGFWSRLFDPAAVDALRVSQTQLLAASKTAVRLCTYGSYAILVGILAAVTRSHQNQDQNDRTFALTVIAMLLVAPITWPHYFLILPLPIAIAWRSRPHTWPARIALAMVVTALIANHEFVWDALGTSKPVAQPIDTLGILSFPCYALLGLFSLSLSPALLHRRDLSARRGEDQPA